MHGKKGNVYRELVGSDIAILLSARDFRLKLWLILRVTRDVKTQITTVEENMPIYLVILLLCPSFN